MRKKKKNWENAEQLKREDEARVLCPEDSHAYMFDVFLFCLFFGDFKISSDDSECRIVCLLFSFSILTFPRNINSLSTVPVVSTSL